MDCKGSINISNEALYLYEQLKIENEELINKLTRIKEWALAYPIENFPEPDFIKCNSVLTAAGLSLGAISASNMRHVVSQISKIIEGQV